MNGVAIRQLLTVDNLSEYSGKLSYCQANMKTSNR